MQSQFFVKNHGKNIRKTFSLRMLFNLLFVTSLGFNMYFIVSQYELGSVGSTDEVGSQVKKNTEESSVELHSTALKRQSLESRLKTNIHEEESVKGFNLVETSSYKVERVLFDPSIQPNKPSIQTLKLKVKNSLNYTICHKAKLGDECDSLAAHIARLMAWFLDVNKEMRNGDGLNVVYERLDNEGQFKILQLIYTSNYLKKTMEANFYKERGAKYGGYFDRNGKEISQRIVKEQSPIDEYMEIVSLPGDFRKGRRGHAGTDFKAEVGTPIRSTFDGRVSRANWNRRANGYCIEVDHPNQKIKTRYLHLSRVLVKRGQYVKQGEIIGKSGNTGRSFAPHLHYEVRGRSNKNTVYNPFDFKYHKTYQRDISDQERGEFKETVSIYDAFYDKNKIERNVQAD
ncbi:MAG: M23 family metallopeptidase [Nitrospina sp.]|nr:M23 family metallopeptidase [Nitrospina sp.]